MLTSKNSTKGILLKSGRMKCRSVSFDIIGRSCSFLLCLVHSCPGPCGACSIGLSRYVRNNKDDVRHTEKTDDTRFDLAYLCPVTVHDPLVFQRVTGQLRHHPVENALHSPTSLLMVVGFSNPEEPESPKRDKRSCIYISHTAYLPR